jgi:hypothetical protein
MDFAKYVSLVSSSSLFFSRSDRFADPFEGSLSQGNLRLRPTVYSAIPTDQQESLFSQMSNFSRWARQWTYINCWHLNEHESAAMWDLYAKINEAVAVETTYDRLLQILPKRVFLGCVNYIDYGKDWLPEGNSLYPFMHKRKSFEHEREVRAIIHDLPCGELFNYNKINESQGQHVPIALNDLIVAVHVSPTAPVWFTDLVSQVTEKYELSVVVARSDLYSSPVF